MNISDIFIDGSNRLRSGWRFSAFAVIYILAVVVVGSLASPILRSRDDAGAGLIEQALYLAAGYVALLIPAIAVGWFCGRVFEYLPFRALGAWFSAGWLSHFMLGLAFGGVTLLAAIAIAVTGGGLGFEWNTVEGNLVTRTLLASLIVFGIAAAFEEAVFRGYVLQTFARSGLAWFAIGMTSLFFGLAHLNNPGSNLIAILNTMLAGVWFGVAYLKTRDLWFVWGLHLIWNWMQGAVFGIEVSGLTELTRFPLLTETDTGPEWLTGGPYGLEGGLACTVALLFSAGAIWLAPFVRTSADMLTLTSPPAETASTEDHN